MIIARNMKEGTGNLAREGGAEHVACGSQATPWRCLIRLFSRIAGGFEKAKFFFFSTQASQNSSPGILCFLSVNIIIITIIHTLPGFQISSIMRGFGNNQGNLSLHITVLNLLYEQYKSFH